MRINNLRIIKGGNNKLKLPDCEDKLKNVRCRSLDIVSSDIENKRIIKRFNNKLKLPVSQGVSKVQI